MTELIHSQIFGNELQTWLIAVGIWLGSAVLLRLLLSFASRRIAALAARTETQWDDLLAEILGRSQTLFLAVTGLYLGTRVLVLPNGLERLLDNLLVLALLWQSGLWGGAFIQGLLQRYRRKASEKNPAALTTIGVMGFLSRFLLWSTLVLLALDNIGVDVTALVAGLGIGGVAVALAVQNILGDLFASLSIMLDKPFVVGDFLIIGDFLGSVEHVGLKTTRIRSLSGEQLVFSNSDLLSSRIRNYGRMYQRRVVFKIGVTYQTPRDLLKRIPVIIREAVESQPRTRFDRAHFAAYGAYSLDYETVYYVDSPDFNLHMDIQQAIFFAIHEAFENEGIDFAYPTQTLFVAGGGAMPVAPAGMTPV